MGAGLEALAVSGLSKSFGGLNAVNNVSFQVEVGDRLAIIGPNGAGKTTLFQLISGMLPPSRGSISVYGKEITGFPPYRRAKLGLGRTFQITKLFLKLTVLENVVLALEALDKTKFGLLWPLSSYKDLLGKAEEALEQWGMREKRDFQVRNLSYGEQRRLEIVLTLSQGRSILLLDEPTAGLSSEEAKEFVSMIGNLSPEITVLMIDHDIDILFEIARRVIVLHFGTVVACGTPDEVRMNPQVQEIYMGEDHGSS
jgi:branched-chain amino acid transport system ATP-binding protein